MICGKLTVTGDSQDNSHGSYIISDEKDDKPVYKHIRYDWYILFNSVCKTWQIGSKEDLKGQSGEGSCPPSKSTQLLSSRI